MVCRQCQLHNELAPWPHTDLAWQAGCPPPPPSVSRRLAPDPLSRSRPTQVWLTQPGLGLGRNTPAFITRTKREGLKAARSKSRYFIWFQDCDLSMIRLSLLTPETTSTYHTITTTLYNVTLLVIYVFIIMYMTSYVICHVIDVCQIGKKGIKCWILKHFYLDLT